MHWTVIEYCVEEVQRQGHDVLALDGIERVGWMLQGWAYALENNHRKPTIVDAAVIGSLVEQHKNKLGFRKCGVRVGSRVCPDHKKIEGLLTDVFLRLDGAKPLDFYRAFEEVHPFVDGNGRTGKILLNWLNGSLLDPIFPPNDFWGHSILNP